MADQKELVKKLQDHGYLRTPHIIEAFLDIDRGDFTLDEFSKESYEDYPLPIGFKQTLSQPLVIAFMLELLEPKAGDNILEVGSGSGWQTALLAHTVGETGNIHSLDIIESLSNFAENNCEKYGYVKNGLINFYIKNGWRGLPQEAPFDKIIVSAAANEIPKELLDQLKVGGRLVAPIGETALQDIVLIEKHGEKESQLKEERFPGFTFVPLVEKE